MAAPKAEGPLPVVITEEQQPIPVTVEAAPPAPKPHTVQAGQGTVLAPTTTEQEDIVTAGQRRVNLVWELTQAIIAVSITLAIIYTATTGVSNDAVTNAFFLIIGFYFSRTNHSAIGGVGRQPDLSKYTGR